MFQKTYFKYFLLYFFGVLLSASVCYSQITPQDISGFIKSEKFAEITLHSPGDVKRFYELTNYEVCWLNISSHDSLLYYLTKTIHLAESLGLRKTDYYPLLFDNSNTRLFATETPEDSIAMELKYTDAAIHFFHDVALGNKEEVFSYNGLNYSPSCIDIAGMLSDYIKEKKFRSLLNNVEPQNDSYIALKKQLSIFLNTVSEKKFKDIFITSSKADNTNVELLTRLNQLGLKNYDADSAKHPKTLLKLQIKKAQELFNLLNDGELRSTIIHELNIPFRERIADLANALNACRWLRCVKEKYSHVIIINIPSASLAMTENEKDVVYSRIIIGKKSTPTPLFTAQVTQVILYPYWYVPHSIAIKELLPAIKHDIHFLEDNNFQLLNKQGKLCDPTEINWQKLNRNNFPYTIRQSTGCDNSLGVIKLNLNSPYDVYMHDTPWKILFGFNNRYFSHGCIRVEKASELAHYVLKDNTISIDTIEEKECLKNQEPVIIPASEKIPVVVIYHTAWTDSVANVHFYENVYHKKVSAYNAYAMPGEWFSWLWQKIAIILHTIFISNNDIMLSGNKSIDKNVAEKIPLK
ncbi:MAG: L,D-transpeptidase family protein [Bacteroidetes bacterium]|nr:L,D-transpeptidase family protein [Bacteroidota bacterium]